MNVLVGCPVHKRQWILPHWFAAVEESFNAVGLTPSYVFAFDPRDKDQHAALIGHADRLNRELHEVHVTDSTETEPRRWDKPERLAHMVDARNALLGRVREIGPDLFLSVDSDIILTPKTLQDLIETAQGDCAAVGGKVYLTRRGTRCPSFGYVQQGRFVRGKDTSDVIQGVGVLMALKIMKPHAYAVDYEYHVSGEDIGWSHAVTAAGMTLTFDGRSPSQHVWSPEQLSA